MFQKLVGGLFGEGDIPWNLVGWGAAVGIAAILLDHFVLEPRKTKFRLYPMPLAVGMYLPWTVTTPILCGGIVYKIVDRSVRGSAVIPPQYTKASSTAACSSPRVW